MATKKTSKTKTTKKASKTDRLAWRKKKRQELIRNARKHLDGSVFTPASDLTNIYLRRRSTGVVGLDRITNGGYPHGCNVVLVGKPGAGKDLLLNLAIRENQRAYGEESAVGIIYLEQGGWDKQHARNVGVQVNYSPEEISILEEIERKTYTAAEKKAMKSCQIGEIDVVTPDTTEAALDYMRLFAESGIYQIVILNSIDAMSSSAERDSVDENGIGAFDKGRGGEGRALLLSAHYRNQNAIMMAPFEEMEDGGKLRETTFFWVSQFRMAHTSQYSVSHKSISGGQSVQYYSALTIEVEKGKKDERTYMGPKDDKNPAHIPTSDMHRVYINKGKYGIATGEMCEFRFYHHNHYDRKKLVVPIGTIDESGTLRSELVKQKFLVRRGAEYHLTIPGTDEVVIIPGKRNQVDDRLRTDSELRERILEAFRVGQEESETSEEEEA
jgi:RecA/RadA recombinase